MIMPYVYDTPLFRSALAAWEDFPGQIVLVHHKNCVQKELFDFSNFKNPIINLCNKDKCGADDAIELGLHYLNDQKINYVFYCHSDCIVYPGWFDEFLPVLTDERNKKIQQWNFRHNHYYFRDQDVLKQIQSQVMNYETLQQISTQAGILNHESQTDDRKIELSKDFWGSHRAGRTSPLTVFAVPMGLEALNAKPSNTWALFDVSLSRILSSLRLWDFYYNGRSGHLHISGSGHDGFGSDTGSFAHATSSFIEQDNELFRKYYGYMPDDFLNFKYQEIYQNYREELTEAANEGRLADYDYLADLIRERF